MKRCMEAAIVAVLIVYAGIFLEAQQSAPLSNGDASAIQIAAASVAAFYQAAGNASAAILNLQTKQAADETRQTKDETTLSATQIQIGLLQTQILALQSQSITVTTFANLGTVPAAGTKTKFCSDCTTTPVCAGSGTGHLAVSNGTNWTCQ